MPAIMPSSLGPAFVTDAKPRVPFSFGGKYFALAVLFSMNLLNYIDRYSFAAVGKLIQTDLHISNTRYGILYSAFMVVYTIITPLIGWMGDRYSRRKMLAFGVGLWSLATVGTAFSTGFKDMFFWRALLGVGEASYGVIAPTLLADLFTVKSRGRVMGLYYLALPLGGAIGYGLGGWIGQEASWRAAFLVVGVPGLVAAAAGMLILDPGRGASEGHTTTKSERPKLKDYVEIFQTPTFVFNTAGMAAVTFLTGAYAAWGSTFFQTVRGMQPKQAGVVIGAMTAVAALIGIAIGTWAADLLLKYTRRAYMLLGAAAVFLSIPLGVAGIMSPDLNIALPSLFLAMLLISMVLGPSNTVTANVVPPNRRAAGFALNVFLIHLFGDISSPNVIGLIADIFGKPAVADSLVGRMFADIGAAPVKGANLTVGMLTVLPVLASGVVFFLLGSRYLPRDQDHALRHDDTATIATYHHH